MSDPDFAEVGQQFLDAFTYLEQSVSTVTRHRRNGVSWLHWPETGRRGGRYHFEFFGVESDPATVVEVVRAVNPQQLYFISDIYSVRGPKVAEYAAAGFETRFQEPMMVLDLESEGIRTNSVDVIDVESIALAQEVFTAFVNAGDHARQTSQKQIDDPRTLIKAILIDNQPAATGKGILLGETLYVTDIGTVPAYRKRGFGAAVMTALHDSAKALGATGAILSATQMAAGLYHSLGYRDVGTLDIYEPVNAAD